MSESEFAFQSIYVTYQPHILRYLARLVGEAEAEDLAQEVFTRASQALGEFRSDSRLSTWLYRIATNVAIDRLRSPAFRQDAQADSLDELEDPGDRDAWAGEELPSIEQILMKKEMYACFLDFLEKVPRKYRTVFVFSELGGLTNNEIARILGLSLETVKIRLHRGRRMLFKELKDHCKAEDWL